MCLLCPFRGPKAGKGNKVYFFYVLSFIRVCFERYFQFYFHVFYVASFDKHSHRVISVIFAFILVLRLPFEVSKVYQP